MYYAKKNIHPRLRKGRVFVYDFSSGISTAKDEKLVPLYTAVRSFNTDFKSGALTDGFGISVAIFIFFRFMKYHLWLILITFKLPLKKMYKNCFIFAFVNWKANIIIGLTELLLAAICIGMFFIPYYIAWVVSLALATMVFPGFIHLLTQTLIFPKVKELMIDPYYEEHPDEDIQLRKNLGLEVEENDESVFEDKHIEDSEQ